MLIHRKVLPLLLLSVICLAPIQAIFANELIVTQITPGGENVPASNQILITFNKNVVPLGRMERSASEVPVTIRPALECQWRWLTPNSLACQLDRGQELTLATKYQLVIGTGPLNEEGDHLRSPYKHALETSRPKISGSNFHSITERGKPFTHIYFNQAVTHRSAMAALTYQYTVNGRNKAVGAQIFAYEDVRNGNIKKPEFITTKKSSDRWLAKPRKALPKNTAVKLIVKPGLAAPHGKLKSTESGTIDEFHTFDDFKFIGITCADTSFNRQQYLANELDRAKCNPVGGLSLDFSAPMDPHQLHDALQLWESSEATDALDKAWSNQYSRGRLTHQYHKQGQLYSVNVPTALKPNLPYEIRSLANSVSPKDALGRPINNTIQAQFLTRHYTPAFNLPYQDVVLEAQINSDVPLTLMNIDTLRYSHFTNTQQGISDKPINHAITPGFDKDLQAIIPLGVRELLNNSSGMVSGYVSSDESTLNRDQRVVAQITPYHVHAKIGHFSSLVWVTDLATGELVDDAQVSVITAQNSIANKGIKVLESVTTNSQGLANLSGLSELDPFATIRHRCGASESCQRLFVKVTKNGNSAVLPIQYNYQVNSHGQANQNIYSDRKLRFGHTIAWGTTAQGLYRQGDTIQYKIYVRDQNLRGLAAAPKGKYSLEVEDENGNIVHSRDEVSLNEFGTLGGELKLAADAAMGWYHFRLRIDFDDEDSSELMLPALKVLVTDFTPSPFRLAQSLNGDLFSAGDSLIINADATLHSGGPFTGAEASFEVYAQTASFVSGNASTKDFNFSDSASYEYHYDDYEELLSKTVALNAAGQATAELALPQLDKHFVSAAINVQTYVEDDRGKSVFSNGNARYLGVDRLVGLKSRKWVYESGKNASLDYVVVDKLGNPTTGTAVNIVIEKRETQVTKTKGRDSAYPPRYTENWVRAAECVELSQNTVSSCSFTPKSAGIYRFSASIKDTQGRPHNASQQIWVSGEGYVNWQDADDNSLVLVTEKDSLSVGDTARYLVKNPYPGAQAIVTIERYGILDSWQQTLEGSTPIIEFDIKPEYLPGVYLSVLVTRPRTASDIPEANQEDQTRPTYKLGYQKLAVTDPERAIKVQIESDSPSYKPGETVTLTIKPQLQGVDDDTDIELTVSVLDEAVFDLVRGASDYFDPYKGLSEFGNLDVSNYNLLTRLIGLRKFSTRQTHDDADQEHKLIKDDAVAYYADSIALASRSAKMEGAFDEENMLLEEVTVSGARTEGSNEPANSSNIQPRDNMQDSAHWKDSATVNQDGSITIKFKLPDNLTAWRVLALATTATDRQGLGEHSFTVNQLTEIRPVMPNQVMETDRFNAGFSVHNRSKESRTLTVTVDAEGDTQTSTTFKQTVELAPYARESIFVPMAAKRLAEGQYEGRIKYTVRAYDENEGDALSHSLPVQKRRNMTSAAVYGSTLGDTAQQTIAFPSNIATDLGGLAIKLSPTIISNVDGAFEYMRGYPYACWEQRLTKGVMASHYKSLKPYLNEQSEWPNSQELPQKTLDYASSFQADNGGMAYFLPETEYVSPYLSAYTALAFTWLNDAGYKVPVTVQENLHEYLIDLLRNDNFPEYFSEGMKATVRAVALSALAKNGDLAKSDVLRYHQRSQAMSLFGKTQILAALKQFDDTETEQRAIVQQILANSNSSAGKIGFNDPKEGNFARILSTHMRTNCAILDSLSNSANLLVDQDLPSKLAQQVVANRGNRNHWENAQDNVFCMNALKQYAQNYEAQTPDLSATVSLNNKAQGSAQFTDYKDPSKTIKVPMRAVLVGSEKSVEIQHDGIGRLYYQTLLQYSSNEDQLERENSGIDLRRELSVYRDQKWQLLEAKDTIERGELVRTDLFVSVPADRNFVALRDPVAGGLEPVNTDLATSGTSLSASELHQTAPGSYLSSGSSWQSFSYSPYGFYHKELGHDAVVFYSDHLSKGQYHLSYFSQAIATGEFSRQSALAEEMYQPDVYGKSAAGTLIINENTD